MPHPLYQLDLFGGPAVPVSPQAPEPEPAPPAPDFAGPLPGQLTLEEARSTRLSPVVEALSAGRFAHAAEASSALPGERAVAVALHALAAAASGCADGEALAGLDLAPLCAPLHAAAASALSSAAVRGRAAAVAQALASQHPRARARGELAATWWLAAEQAERAVAAVDLLLADEPHDAEALLLRGNSLHARGEVGRARLDYRHALRADARCVRLEQIADEDVRLLAPEAAELGLSPVEPWLPFVGLVTGVFPLLAFASDRPATAQDRFEAALLRCRASRAQGRIDVQARRELKGLAPALFARLLEDGLA